MLQLETYKGTKSRHTCPACGARHSFVRYVSDDGNYIDDSVGRCNRESNCNYHKKPKEFFAENPHLSNLKQKRPARANYGFVQPLVSSPVKDKLDFIEQSYLLRTLGNYENNAFAQFLFNLFPEDSESVEKAVKDYLIGTSRSGKTIFWQIDRRRNVRTGKIIAYDPQTGKRRKDIFPNWIHSELKRSGHLKEDFNLRQCFFGEHLLTIEKQKPIAVVEAEKTALIASICFPEFVWVAVGAKGYLKAEKLNSFAGRQIILYPDADGFTLWQDIAKEARSHGLTVKVSSLIERHATGEQKANGYDLADYLINRQKEINECNEYADAYNAKLQKVSEDKVLRQGFDSWLEEQKSVMMVDGGLSEIEAENLITRPEKLRRVVMSL